MPSLLLVDPQVVSSTIDKTCGSHVKLKCEQLYNLDKNINICQICAYWKHLQKLPGHATILQVYVQTKYGSPFYKQEHTLP